MKASLAHGLTPIHFTVDVRRQADDLQNYTQTDPINYNKPSWGNTECSKNTVFYPSWGSKKV